MSTVVFIPNATTGVNTVLRNMVWNADGQDEIIQLDVIYGACGKTTSYVCEASNYRVRTREVQFDHPLEDVELISTFKAAIQTSRKEGFRPRIAIFDTISSNPGLRLPFNELTEICRSEGVLSLIDAAHGVGHIELNLSALDPDFFVSNCHKWMFTPRSCAVFYVPQRNQHMLRSTLPTSHGFVPSTSNDSRQPDLIGKSSFELNFEFVGTFDNIPFLTVSEAIRWRREVCGGEQKILSYCNQLAQDGGKRVAQILETRVLDNESHTLTDCCMVNILLPISIPTTGCSSFLSQPDGTSITLSDWMQQAMIKDYNTFMPVFPFQGCWWVRLSGQIYLDHTDFEWAGWNLKKLCDRVREHTSNRNLE